MFDFDIGLNAFRQVGLVELFDFLFQFFLVLFVVLAVFFLEHDDELFHKQGWRQAKKVPRLGIVVQVFTDFGQ